MLALKPALQWKEALSKVERLVLREIEASNDRVVLHEALLHLIVSGNCMIYIGEEGMRVFHLNRYVITRDPMGNPIEAIICEVLTYDTAPRRSATRLMRAAAS